MKARKQTRTAARAPAPKPARSPAPRVNKGALASPTGGGSSARRDKRSKQPARALLHGPAEPPSHPPGKSPAPERSPAAQRPVPALHPEGKTRTPLPSGAPPASSLRSPQQRPAALRPPPPAHLQTPRAPERCRPTPGRARPGGRGRAPAARPG